MPADQMADRENLNGLTDHDIEAMRRQADLTPFQSLLQAAMTELLATRKELADLRERLAALAGELEQEAECHGVKRALNPNSRMANYRAIEAGKLRRCSTAIRKLLEECQ